jgi:hypothetical protein
LDLDLLGAEVAAIVARGRLRGQAGAVGGGVEALGLFEDARAGFAVAAAG